MPEILSPVPGLWVCPRCRFQQHRRIIPPAATAIGVDTRLSREPCPNDGELLVQGQGVRVEYSGGFWYLPPQEEAIRDLHENEYSPASLFGRLQAEQYGGRPLVQLALEAKLMKTLGLRLVTQTRLGEPQGNCAEAVYASLLGLDLAAVPDVWDGSDTVRLGVWPNQAQVDLEDWLFDLGYQMVVWDLREGDLHFPLSREQYDLFVWESGAPGPFKEGMVHRASGPNPDGVQHAVIVKDGEIVWDPNPARRGIEKVNWVSTLLPLVDIPEAFRLERGQHCLTLYTPKGGVGVEWEGPGNWKPGDDLNRLSATPLELEALRYIRITENNEIHNRATKRGDYHCDGCDKLPFCNLQWHTYNLDDCMLEEF